MAELIIKTKEEKEEEEEEDTLKEFAMDDYLLDLDFRMLMLEFGL